MERPVTGNVVVCLFPFSNLAGKKLRPALVLAPSEFNNLILCQITSKPYSSKIAIRLTHEDFSYGKLPINSYICPDKLFTADVSIIQKVAGKITKTKQRSVLNAVRHLFKE